MRNFGHALAAFTIWAATAAAFAQTPPAAPSAASSPASPEAVSPETVMRATPTPATPTPATATPPVVTPPAGPPPMVAVPQAVYVTNFIAMPAGAPPSGLLAHLRAALHAHSAGRNAGLVAQAVVQRLSHAGVAARYLAPDEPPPVQGWLIGGVFHLEGSQAPAASDGEKAAPEAFGAQVSVTVADLEHGADTPFAIIGAPPDATGEAGKWHPYVLPAKLSFEREDRNAAVAALAQQIADTFVGNMTALRQADAKAISR